MARGVSVLVATLILIVISTIASVVLYLYLTHFFGEVGYTGEKPKIKLKLEAVQRLMSGGLKVYLHNVGDESVEVDRVYILDLNDNILESYPTELQLNSGDIGSFIIPALKLAKISEKVDKIRIMVSCKSGESSLSYIIEGVLRVYTPKPTYIGLQAIRYSLDTHWVVFDYLTGRYELYDDTGGTLQGPYEGMAPILEGVDEYTITTRWVSWDDRPIDSPILIVVNPTGGYEDWVFTWKDPHGVHKFLLQSVGEEGQIEIDFLVFWEDLFNPYNPPGSVDDWKDHVVRVTLYVNGTFRIAVFLAKGGYSHKFYLNVPEGTFDNLPSQVDSLIYTKPFGVYWQNRIGGYYREIPDKIFLV